MWVVAAGPKLGAGATREHRTDADAPPSPLQPSSPQPNYYLPSPPSFGPPPSAPLAARSPAFPLPRDVVATAARRRRRGAGGGRWRGRRRWEVAGLRRGGVLGRAVRGGGRRAVRLVPALRRAPSFRPPLRAAGVPDPHGRLRLRAYATPPNLLPSSTLSLPIILSAPVIADERSYRCGVASLSSNSSMFPKVESPGQSSFFLFCS